VFGIIKRHKSAAANAQCLTAMQITITRLLQKHITTAMLFMGRWMNDKRLGKRVSFFFREEISEAHYMYKYMELFKVFKTNLFSFVRF
jgi:hypothetical protein